MTLVEAEDLTKDYGDVRALDGLDLTVEAGSVHGLVGPNGAGKTTAMQLIVGLISPTAGEARVGGEPAGSVAAKERIGYSPQQLAPKASMSGRRYLTFVGRVAGLDRSAARDRAAELIEWLDLEAAAERRIGGYSGGMRRRISLAQALVHEPDLLVLDEPTAGLDPSGRQQVMDALEAIPEAGTTVFVSSHVLAELEQYVDVVTILRDGEEIVTDDVDVVQRTYGGEAIAVRTDDDETARELLAGAETVGTVEATEDRLLVTTDEPDACRREIQERLLEHDVALQSLSAEGTLQEAFVEAVDGEQRGSGDVEDSEEVEG